MATHTATVSTKGQLVIPSDLREALDLAPGTRIAILREGNRLILQPVNKQFVKDTRGMTASKTSLSDALIKDRRDENKKSGW